MNVMKHNGYLAKIHYSDKEQLFIGKLACIENEVTFQANSVGGLKTAMVQAVENYLNVCKQQGLEPQKNYSGKFVVRVGPEIHARAVVAAEAGGKSLNVWVVEAMTEKALQAGI